MQHYHKELPDEAVIGSNSYSGWSYELKVRIKMKRMSCRVVNGGTIGDRKNVNIRGYLQTACYNGKGHCRPDFRH